MRVRGKREAAVGGLAEDGGGQTSVKAETPSVRAMLIVIAGTDGFSARSTAAAHSAAAYAPSQSQTAGRSCRSPRPNRIGGAQTGSFDLKGCLRKSGRAVAGERPVRERRWDASRGF